MDVNKNKDGNGVAPLSKDKGRYPAAKRKTYAAKGMLDWQYTLQVAGAFIRICFSGGTIGCNGVVPARYVTDSPAIQYMLEQSPQFRNGQIILLKTEKLEEKENPENQRKDESDVKRTNGGSGYPFGGMSRK